MSGSAAFGLEAAARTGGSEMAAYLSGVGPVKVLDHVSQSLEPLKVWLVRVAVNGKEIDLEGRAATNDDVVEFVNNLRRTDYFANINLQESRAAVESQLNIYQFKLGFRLKG